MLFDSQDTLFLVLEIWKYWCKFFLDDIAFFKAIRFIISIQDFDF